MAWNQRDKVTAMAVTIQPTPGLFNTPGLADILGVASVDTGQDALKATDPTLTGGLWDAPDIYLGKTGSGGGNIPLRGPGGVAPPAGNGWAVGRILQACGFAELVQAAPINGVLQAGSTVNQVVLANGESSVDDALLGAPLNLAAFGTGFRGTSIIRDYVGATRTALLAETVVAPAAGAAYTIPAHLSYLLTSGSSTPVLLSIRIWKDRRIYDFKDCVISSWTFDAPVSNEAQQSFPSIAFQFKGVPIANSTVGTTPSLPTSILGIPVPGARGGKFMLDRVKLGHAGLKYTIGLTAGAASNQNQDAGQDGYDILSGTRTIDLDLNQMDVADFDLDTRVDQQTLVSALSTWGNGVGNQHGLMIQDMYLQPPKVGARNGYVSLTTSGGAADVANNVAYSVWWQ